MSNSTRRSSRTRRARSSRRSSGGTSPIPPDVAGSPSADGAPSWPDTPSPTAQARSPKLAIALPSRGRRGSWDRHRVPSKPPRSDRALLKLLPDRRGERELRPVSHERRAEKYAAVSESGVGLESPTQGRELVGEVSHRD